MLTSYSGAQNRFNTSCPLRAAFVSRTRFLLIALAFASPLNAQQAAIEGKSKLKVNVGMTGYVKQVVFEGTELTEAEVDPRRTPIAIRIDQVYAHAEKFRYDLTFFGLEPGQHNLVDYLERKDGSSTDDLPEILITVNSILPSEQFAPSTPGQSWVARIGGYRNLVALALCLWVAGLLAIIFMIRKTAPKTKLASAANEAQSQMDQIRSLIDEAIQSGALTESQKADLDMRVLNFWRDRRQLKSESVAGSLATLKEDEQAGPLLKGLENWFYSRRSPTHEEIVAFLEPMTKLAAAIPSKATQTAGAAS